MGKQRSWVCTLVTQVSLCVGFYLALNLGLHQNPIYQNRNGSHGVDVYFVSVRGGHRRVEQETRLLKLMETVARMYKVMFVVNISVQGEDDPLTQKARSDFSSLNVPWYTTRDSNASKVGCFLQQVNITHGKLLNVIGVDTRSLQDFMLTGSMGGYGNNQLNWLTRRLDAMTSNWLIVVGYEPLCVCEENKEQVEAKKGFEHLQHILMKYGVNAYLSRQGCTNHSPQGGLSYIGMPHPVDDEPDLVSSNGSSAFQKEMVDGFLLHRVSSLELATYFVTSSGEVVNKTVIQQRGKEAM